MTPTRIMGGTSDYGFSGSLPDNTPPFLSAQVVNGVTSSGGTPSVTTDEGNGTLYMVVVPDGNSPSIAQIKAGLNSSGGAALVSENQPVSSSGTKNFSTISSLSASTAYDCWFVQTDAAGNNATPVKADFTTSAAVGDFLNEPAGMTLISSRPFNALYVEGWDEPTNGQPESNVQIRQDATAPKSPSNYLAFIYRAGSSGGGAPWDADSPNFLYKTVYVKQWTRFSTNWQGHPGSAINKMYYLYTSTDVPSIVIVLNGANAGPLVPFIEGQNIVSGGQGSADPQNPDWGPNLGVPAAQTQVTRGEWFNIELVAQMNTVGNTDGFMKLWLNGLLITHIQNVKFQNSSPSWRSLHHAPVWGGGGGTVANTMTQDWDHLYVSGKN